MIRVRLAALLRVLVDTCFQSSEVRIFAHLKKSLAALAGGEAFLLLLAVVRIIWLHFG